MIGLWVMLAAGCAARSKPAPLMEENKQAQVTRKEINYQLFDFVARYSRRIEFAADQIAGSTSNPEIQRQSLLWKLGAVPAASLATLAELRAQPLALQIDAEKTGSALVDRLFARAMVLCAVGYGVVLVTILLAYAFLRRQQRPQARDWTKGQYRSLRQK